MTTITIRHTHEDGTLVEGTSKGDGVYELIGPRTEARFRWMPSIRMIGIRNSRDQLAKRYQINAAAEALRGAGFEVVVEIDDTPRDVAQVRADQAGRLEDRYDALAAKAARRQAEGDRRHEAAEQISERFAGGQPILVGHHSERRARKDHERMDGHDRAANAAWSEAEEVARRASAVGSDAAYRERPGVIRRRIDKTEAELRKTRHYINGTRPANDWRGAYGGFDRKPATGGYLEQLRARETFLVHQIEGDRALLAEHEAAGYTVLSRENVHKGDTVTWSSRFGDGATVTRVNPKTVTLDRDRWPSKLGYEQIKTVQCPHEGTTTTVTAAKPAAVVEREPVPVKAERPAERPAPLVVDRSAEFFPTPGWLAARMVVEARVGPGETVLEPSAGAGAIASKAVAAGGTVDCIERDGQLADRLRGDGRYRIVRCADFLEVEPGHPGWDRVLMNPPFGRRADVAHVSHALGFVEPGGMLVAVMSAGIEFHSYKASVALRDLVEESGGRIEALPEDAFKDTGTCVRTVLVVIPVPAAAPAPEPVPEPALLPAAADPPPPALVPADRAARLRDQLARLQAEQGSLW